jgi:hypothetical protein
MAYHPTELTLLTENCPAALDMREKRIPYDRTLFAAGIAAHAIMETAGNKVRELKRQLESEEIAAIAAEVVKRLIGEGRSYDGKPEPPLNPERVFEGRDMAVKYLNNHSISTTGLCEIGFAYDKSWNSVDYYAENARFRTILDVLDVVEDGNEEWVGRILEVTDYKTSWRSDKSELDTLQRRAQAVTVWKSKYCKDVDGIRLRIVNLRTGGEYTREVWLTENGQQTLKQWQSDLEQAMDAADWKTPGGDRPASPGIRCMNCSYVLSCNPAKEFVYHTDLEDCSPEAVAGAYATAKSITQKYEKMAREACDRGVINTSDGLVGFIDKVRKVAAATAPDRLWATWKGAGGDVVGLLTAMKPGSSNLENAAKKLYGRGAVEQRKDLIDELIEKQPYASFGIQKKTEDKGK